MVSRVLAANVKEAMALGDTLRKMIVDMLARRPMSVEEIVQELRKKGVKKAPTTVRHHVDILKRAGVIELARVEEMRGGVMKYYAPRVRMLSHSYSADLGERLAEPISEATDQLLRIVKNLAGKHRGRIKKAARSLKPCPYCSPEHFVEQTLVEILNRAMSASLRRSDFAKVVRELSAKG